MTLDSNPASSTEPSRPARRTTYWDRVAETRWGSYLTAIERRVILQAQELPGQTGAAIDAGCGSGRWSKMISDLGWKVTCVEKSPEALEICRINVPAAKTILTGPDENSLPCETGAAKLLLCIEVPPLIQAGWFPEEVRRVLAEDGVFVGVYMNRHSWRGLACQLKYRWKREAYQDVFYTSAYSDWRRRLEQTGFKLVHEESCCWGPFSRASNSFLVPLFHPLRTVGRSESRDLAKPLGGLHRPQKSAGSESTGRCLVDSPPPQADGGAAARKGGEGRCQNTPWATVRNEVNSRRTPAPSRPR